MSKQILKSVYLNPMINMKKPHQDLWCPVFKFGRKKSDEFRFPVVFNNEEKALEAMADLEKLVGKEMEEVKAGCAASYEKFKAFDYKEKTKKPTCQHPLEQLEYADPESGSTDMKCKLFGKIFNN